MNTLPLTFARDVRDALAKIVVEFDHFNEGGVDTPAIANARRCIKIYDDAAQRQRKVIETIAPEQVAALREFAATGGERVGKGYVPAAYRDLCKLGLVQFEMGPTGSWTVQLSEKGTLVLS